MALQDGVHFPQSEEMLFGEKSSLTPCSVQDGAGMTLHQENTKHKLQGIQDLVRGSQGLIQGVTHDIPLLKKKNKFFFRLKLF